MLLICDMGTIHHGAGTIIEKFLKRNFKPDVHGSSFYPYQHKLAYFHY